MVASRTLPLLFVIACGPPGESPTDAGPGGDTDAADAARPACDPSAEETLYKLTSGPSTDEDGTFFADDSGNINFAYISNQRGRFETYVTRTTGGVDWDGETWSRPTLVLPNSQTENLFNFATRSIDGRYHLTGRFGTSAVATTGRVSTLDLGDWGEVTTLEPTTPGDFTFTAGSLQQHPVTGEYWLVFISRDADLNLYIQRSTDGDNWTGLDGNPDTPPTRLTNSDDEDFIFSFLITPSGRFILVWQRYSSDEGGALPYFGPSGDIYMITSDDGQTWSAEQKLTEDGANPVMDALPWLHERPDGELWVTWMTRRVDTLGDPFAVVTAKVHPTLAETDIRRVPAPGYSIRSHILADGRTILGWARTFDDTGVDYEYRILCDWDFPVP